MQIIKDDNRLLNMDEAANMLGIKKSTLYGMCMRREIAHVKIGKLNRFKLKDLQEFVDRMRKEAFE